MSEMIWCNVKVKIPRTWCNGITADIEAPWFAEDLAEAMCNGWGVEFHATTDNYVILSMSGEGNYGLVDGDIDEVLAVLRELRIPYDAHSDPKYEYSGETYIFTGIDADGGEGRMYGRVSDADGQITFSESQWASVKDKGDAAILKALREWFDTPVLEEIDISHLPVECPTRDSMEEEDVEDVNAVL